jgi:AraC family transcriptional regulator, regulatory protein of adaptative response / methylated-DNA-[protein]-cysteine methyltransferase
VRPTHNRDTDRWQAVLTKDCQADGTFYYSERSTGTYSRPSCPVRLTRREGVLFFDTAVAAEAAGLRPCRRCRPEQPSPYERRIAIVLNACRMTDQAPLPPSLDDLAAAVGFSRFHFHRLFKSVTGLTPHSYVAARRGDRLRAELLTAKSVTDAIYDAGFNSNGYFYVASGSLLGMTPSSFRSGGESVRIRFYGGHCSLGPVLLAIADRGVYGVLLGSDVAGLVCQLRQELPKASLHEADQRLSRRLEMALKEAEPPIAARRLPEDIRRTVHRQRIREILQSSWAAGFMP